MYFSGFLFLDIFFTHWRIKSNQAGSAKKPCKIAIFSELFGVTVRIQWTPAWRKKRSARPSLASGRAAWVMTPTTVRLNKDAKRGGNKHTRRVAS